MARANSLWLEFLGGTLPMPGCHCGLCGNYGIIDTVGKVSTPAGHPCGVRAYCICPNGRILKRNAKKAAKAAEKAAEKAAGTP